MFATNLDCQLVQALMFVPVFAPCLSREQDGRLSSSLFLNMKSDLTPDSRQSSDVIVHRKWCQWWNIAFLSLTTFGVCLPTQSKDEQDWTGIVLLAMVISALLGMKCGPLCGFILPVCLVQYSFSCILDTKFCLHAAGGIYVQQSFTNSGGEIQISGSSADLDGGAVLRSSSSGLWQDFEMAVGSVRSTPGSENRKRIEEVSVICNQCLRQSLIANWFKSWCFVVLPFPHVSREQDGCLSSSLFLSMIFDLTQDSGQPYSVIVHDVMSMMEYGFSHLENIRPLPTYSIKGWAGLNKYSYPCNCCRNIWNKLWPAVQFYFSNLSSPTAQVKLSCGFGLVVWVFLITLYFDQRKNAKTLINLKNHQWKN